MNITNHQRKQLETLTLFHLIDFTIAYYNDHTLLHYHLMIVYLGTFGRAKVLFDSPLLIRIFLVCPTGW